MSQSQALKLLALDAEDLAVVSAHLQDAVVRVGDLAYLPRDKRFACVLNRFDWLGALLDGDEAPANVRRRAGLRFEQVARARLKGLDLAAKDQVLSLLAITFEADAGEGDAREPLPSGRIELHFSGAATIELHVACIEAELKDLGAAWSARQRPSHPGAVDDGDDETAR
ncbi:MAG: DUF2948 family protein [Hyphomicrobiaceae bacterium]